MEQNILAILIFGGTAAVTGVLGWLIRYRGKVELIAGYDASKVSDPEGLGRLVGGFTLLVAFATLGFIPAGLAGGEPAVVGFGIGYTILIVVGVIVLMVRARRYTKR